MTLDELLDTKRYVFWLDKTKPEQEGSDRYRVSIVFEDEPGHWPTGDDNPLDGLGVLPWYWDEETCYARNVDRGYSRQDIDAIVVSSMFHDPDQPPIDL